MAKADKLKVIVKTTFFPCYCCKGKKTSKKCVCKGTRKYPEKQYYHIYKGMCFDGESLK